MKIFVYEFVTGGGFRSKPAWGSPSDSLLAEGQAMFCAIAEDFARLDNVSVAAIWDNGLRQPNIPGVDFRVVADAEQERSAYEQALRDCDCAFIIAPEFDDELSKRTRLAHDLGVETIGPSIEFLTIASDKWRAYQLLANANVPTPETHLFTASNRIANMQFPVIIKPRWGAGSTDIRQFNSFADITQYMAADSSLLPTDESQIIQSLRAGRAASISLLSNSSRVQWLPPCWQNLSPMSRTYEGGTLLTDPLLVSRTKRIAHETLNAFPPFAGYVGIDVVIGPALDGSEDVVIEINPRLTTSYLGIRKLTKTNLAAVLLSTRGDDMIEAHFELAPMTFDVYGNSPSSDDPHEDDLQ